MISVKYLLKVYGGKNIREIKRLQFFGHGEEEYDVYNISAPFELNGKIYILGRVESRESERDSRIVFFNWPKCVVDESLPFLDLQDPFVLRFNDELIFGGVEVKDRKVKKYLSYRTVFYMFENKKFKNIFHGPWGMKCIRFLKLNNGKIGIFTRPQGRKGRRGKIGFAVAETLGDIGPRIFSRAEIIDGMFARGEWGGVNEVHLLNNGKIGALGHVSKYSNGKKKRHYYPMTFVFNPEKREFSGMKIILRRKDIPKGEIKREDLYDVIYPGGIMRNGDGTASFYSGISDAEAHEILIDDPFLEYEN